VGYGVDLQEVVMMMMMMMTMIIPHFLLKKNISSFQDDTIR